MRTIEDYLACMLCVIVIVGVFVTKVHAAQPGRFIFVKDGGVDTMTRDGSNNDDQAFQTVDYAIYRAGLAGDTLYRIHNNGSQKWNRGQIQRYLRNQADIEVRQDTAMPVPGQVFDGDRTETSEAADATYILMPMFGSFFNRNGEQGYCFDYYDTWVENYTP